MDRLETKGKIGVRPVFTGRMGPLEDSNEKDCALALPSLSYRAFVKKNSASCYKTFKPFWNFLRFPEDFGKSPGACPGTPPPGGPGTGGGGG